MVRVVCLHLPKRPTLVYLLLCCSDSMQYSEYIQDSAIKEVKMILEA